MSFLSPITKPIKRYPLWGFDIETYSKENNFLMGSIVGDGALSKTFWNKEEFIAYLQNKARNLFSKGYICATNLGFDIIGLLEKTKAFERIIPLCKNSRMISVRLPLVETFSRINSVGVRNILRSRGSLKFIDTLNYAPFSVEKWGKKAHIDT